jgi:Icc-related predicted phosphoesterase
MVRLGLISDVHIAPAGTKGQAFHNPYALADATERFRRALGRCDEEGVDAVAVLGDLSHFGDKTSLAEGVRIAAESGSPLWMVPGNHDVLERATALAESVEKAGTSNVRIASPQGELCGAVARVAGVSVVGESGAFVIHPNARPDADSWSDELVLLLTHFPLLSKAERLAAKGLKHAGDLHDVAEVVAPIIERRSPTVVVHGHLHVRDACAMGRVLQLSLPALIEPPFELTVLDVGNVNGQVIVSRRAVEIAPSPEGALLPTLSLSDDAWAFDNGAWRSRSVTALRLATS